MEVPHCPDPAHAGSHVVRAGWYGRAPHERQRWLCHPLNGDPSHRFVELLPRKRAAGAHCLECSTALEPWEGQAGPRTYGFSAREIAYALRLAGRVGGAAVARALGEQRAQRLRPRRTPTPSTRRNWRRNPNLDGQLVANWVDVFAPAILTTLPAAWPEVLLVDSVEYRIGGGVKYGWSFHVFVAVGYERRPGAWFAQPVVWRMQAFPRRRTEEWETFFDSLPGTPRIVISDMATESRTAAATIFPRPGDPAPDIRMCEYHVKERIENALAPVMNQPTHLLVQALPRVFLTPQDWADFEQLVHATHAAGTPPLPLMVRWLRRWSADVGAQVATRPRSGPHSIAGVEETINKVRAPFDYRSSTFGNRPRMNLLLGLITLALRHEVDEVAWADRIRAALIAAGGRLGYQRPHDDPMGFPSLVY